MSDFKVYDSDYGHFIVNQYCKFQGEALETTKRTHIESELENMYKIVDSLPDDAVIIDGGANIGFVTVPLARRKPTAKIISFEAQRRLFYALAGTVAINDLYNVFVYNIALGNEFGVAKMPDINYGVVEDFGSMAIASTQEGMPHVLDSHSTSMTTIDALNLSKLDFIKLDIEGFEPQALMGALHTIKTHRPWMWIEYYNCVDTYNQHIIKDILKDVENYTLHYIQGDGQNLVCVPNEKRDGVDLSFLAGPV